MLKVWSCNNNYKKIELINTKDKNIYIRHSQITFRHYFYLKTKLLKHVITIKVNQHTMYCKLSFIIEKALQGH